MKKNERLEALNILTKVLAEKTPLSHLMQSAKELTPLSKELCFGVCRHYYRLQALADSLMKKRPKESEVWLAILLGLYQLDVMQKPDYAVVQETVALLDSIKKSWAKALVNAVLRNFCREKEGILARLQTKDDFIHNHPRWFVKRMQQDWPNEWQQNLKANDCHPPMSLRVNQRQIQRADYLVRLEEKGMKATPHPYSSVGLRLENPCDVRELPGFTEGMISVQDESAQLAVTLLDLQPGLRLLDACCAPGGKTCHILEAEPRLADCVALDIDDKRLKRVAENLSRLGLDATLLKGDGLKPETWWDGQLFDRILLDAPCSATGIMRRHPDIKLIRTEAEITKVADLQAALLTSLWPLLAKNGLLIYATCSVMSEENERQIARFFSNQTDCKLEINEKIWGQATGHGWQILPDEFGGDGFFYSVLRKI